MAWDSGESSPNLGIVTSMNLMRVSAEEEEDDQIEEAGRKRKEKREKRRTVLGVREIDLQDRELTRDLESSDIGCV